MPGWTQVEGVDGHATGVPGLMLYVTVADCVPIYLLNGKTGSVALLHSGWRGTAGSILTWGVELLFPQWLFLADGHHNALWNMHLSRLL